MCLSIVALFFILCIFPGHLSSYKKYSLLTPQLFYLSLNLIFTRRSGLLVKDSWRPTGGPSYSSLNLWSILMTSIEISSSANLRPIQLRGPWPKGR